MELANLLLAFSIVFIAVPAAVATRPSDGPRVVRAAAGFILISLFFRIAVMFTGLARAQFPGIIIGLWAGWVAAMLIWHGGQTRSITGRAQDAFLRVLRALDGEGGDWLRPRLPRISRMGVWFVVLGAATLFHRAWFPLHNLRFSMIETYSRALDLERFLNRDMRVANGAELVLAPLGVLSGVYADSVIRFSGPIYSTLLVLAVGLCAFRLFQRANVALIASALMAAWPLVAADSHPGEIPAAAIAAVYWVLGAAFARQSRWLTVYAWSTALLISWRISPLLLVAASSIAVAYAVAWLLRMAPLRFRPLAPAIAAGLASVFLFAGAKSSAPDGPFEYEAAARACRDIETRFPRNEWLIVSPVHELAFTYGRGWHFELLDFVSTHTAAGITPKEFTFPYDVADMFVFVEKKPLRPPRPERREDEMNSLDLTQTMDRAVLAYNTGLGRASIEFQAGALLSAYATNHADVSIFREDERLVVFHVKGRREAPLTTRTVANNGS